MVDVFGEAGETEVWLDISHNAGYIVENLYDYSTDRYNEVNKMLYSMIEKTEKFCRGM